MGASWPSRTTKLTHASPGRPAISPTARPSAAAPALTVRWWTASARAAAGGRRYQAALHHNGEHDDHGDDAVETPGIRQAGFEQEDAQQDRHGAVEPGEQDEVPLVALQPRRDQRQSGQRGPDDEGQHRPQDEPRHPHIRPRYHGQVDGKAESDEGDDLGQAG
jgi:hypothetical protein